MGHKKSGTVAQDQSVLNNHVAKVAVIASRKSKLEKFATNFGDSRGRLKATDRLCTEDTFVRPLSNFRYNLLRPNQMQSDCNDRSWYSSSTTYYY